ncbi:MAG: hypothetical protein KJN63_09645 [Acidimicrobiia bacterium]|nr:hypothetical protein [Acidimicrobiia bacterium]
MKVNALIAAVFVAAIFLERNDQDKDPLFWLLVAVGVVAVVGFASAQRSKGGIGATGD